jgi:hypothetical protein
VSATGTPEGDHLLSMIRQLVHGRVDPQHEEVVVEIVARVTVVIFSDPQFYSHLRLVIDLQSRIVQLERALAIATQQPRYVATQRTPAKKSAAKKSAAKRLPVKKAAKPVKKTTKKPPLPYNVKQFRRGAQGQ